MTSREKVVALRRLMKQEGLAAYLVPSTDPHMSEYLPECWKRRQWLSEFTGSAGDLAILTREASLWTDSRYYLQAEQQLDPGVFRLFKKGLPETPTFEAYLARRLKPGQVVGIDARVFSREAAEKLEAALRARKIGLRSTRRNLVDQIWTDRPQQPLTPIVRHADRLAGETAAQKLARMRKELIRQDVDAHVLTALDSIAWLFNIRGTDAEFNPVAIAYAILTRRNATLFIDPRKVPKRVAGEFAGTVTLMPYEAAGAGFAALGARHARVLVDPATTNRWVIEKLKGARMRYAQSPIVPARAVKNGVQAQGMRRCHRRDGVAMVRFLHWLEQTLPQRRMRELDLAKRLEAFRGEDRLYRGPSFDTIVGFGRNAAVVHYSPRTGENRVVGSHGILLIDSGGQYLDGTTDITRTIALGTPNGRQRRIFTLVLKAHIGLARACFPKGTPGSRIEVLARRALWEAGLDYGHGTGHGVGHYLNVHEGPIGFSPKSHAPLEPGHVVSVEPGYYVAGRDGFRTENLVLVVRDRKHSTTEREWCLLESLTLCPIDRTLIDPAMLDAEERRWLDEYHERVFQSLAPRLKKAERAWLRSKTQPI
ncbi:MAG: aminopeptidase P family protein [Candidatus Eisenbacteria sp.]|nr:aminopeptidase P family protein [Candidatus Eisenbacteria bacterium]